MTRVDTSAAELIDRAVTRPVLVFGSPPPLGRDLDLLARTDDAANIHAALSGAGFRPVAGLWLRVGDRCAEVVELKEPAAWGLPASEVDAIFGEAARLPGYDHLLRPGPATTVLLLARRAVRAGDLDERRRARLAEAVADDPRAWERAASRAPSWGAADALAVLRDVVEHRPVSSARRTRALAALQRAGGTRAPVAAARAWRTIRRRPRGRLIAISGLDGAGKSSQAAALAAVLDRCGYPTATRWTRLAGDDVLDRIAEPVKQVLRRVPADRDKAFRAPLDVHPSRVATPEKALRQRSRLVTSAWATVVAAVNGRAQRRSTLPQLRSGTVVVCDRWTLDSAVHLRYRYGESRRFPLQLALIRLLSPRPAVSFFLDIPAETAYSRKDDHYDMSQLARQERLYGEERVRLGVHRLDGRRPRLELTTEIAEMTLRALRAPRRPWRRAA